MKPFYLRSMLSKSMRCIENCSAWSWHWSTEWAHFFSTMMSDHMPQTNTLKVGQIGLQSFASSAIFTWPLTNWLLLLQASWQLFAGKMLPEPAGGRKCFPRVCWIPKHGFFFSFFCYRNIQTFLLGKNVLIVIVPILINKDVFETNYNALTWLETTITFVPT